MKMSNNHLTGLKINLTLNHLAYLKGKVSHSLRFVQIFPSFFCLDEKLLLTKEDIDVLFCR